VGDKAETAILAGGCFWVTQQLLRDREGVISPAETIADVDASGHWPGKTVTEVSEAGRFWKAEAEDQDYFRRFPEGCKPPFQGSGNAFLLRDQ
jgi:peptide methionine sulfoxide reductase MsrA